MIDKQKQIEYFESLLERHGPNFAALDWNSLESQEVRFKVFEEIFTYARKKSNISLLDLGFGLGDLYGYFNKYQVLEKRQISYTGYEISPKFLAAAEVKYPAARFEYKDFLAEKKLPRFDYIFASGVFNMRTGDRESHLEYVRLMLEKMYDLIHVGVAINFLSEDVIPISNQDDLNSGRYFFFKPEEVLGWCRKLCRRYILRHDYHPSDFTVFLLK